MYLKKGFPEVNEFVICTIKQLLPHSVFVSLDEYENKEGIIHASEMSRKIMRNLRTLLKIGSKKVCKVVKIDKEKGHIDLSLRRVGAGQERNKLAQWKNEKTANDVLEVFAKDTKQKIEDVYAKCGNKILDEYGELYPTFIEVAKDGEKVLTELKIPSTISKSLTALIKKRIAIPKISISGKIILTSTASNGLEIVKTAIKKMQDLAKKNKIDFDIKYLGAPSYKFYMSSEDPKIIEKFLTNLTEEIEDYMEKNEGKIEIKRDSK
jgi:translation initiation factor 2 subunit 1